MGYPPAKASDAAEDALNAADRLLEIGVEHIDDNAAEILEITIRRLQSALERRRLLKGR